MNTKLRFVENRYIFYTISGVMLLIALFSLFTKGLNYGIDFKGGNILKVVFEKETDDKAIREVFNKIGTKTQLYFNVDQITIQNVANDKKEFIIQYPVNKIESIEANNVKMMIETELNNEMPYSLEQSSSIGPTIGDELKRQGIIAAFLSCVGILLYLGYRFDFHSAAGVVIAVVHDLIITLGFISIMGSFKNLQITFDTTVLAAILTLLGYSVNDSIVVFDRIRENIRISKNGTAYKQIVNDSINQCISRTINTTITTLLPLFALVLYGGDTLRGFSVSLLFGCLIGTYSSNCLAATCIIDIFKKKGEATKGTDLVPAHN